MGNDSIIAFKTREQLRKYLGIFQHAPTLTDPNHPDAKRGNPSFTIVSRGLSPPARGAHRTGRRLCARHSLGVTPRFLRKSFCRKTALP